MTLVKKPAPLRYNRSDANSWIDFMNAQSINVREGSYGAVGDDSVNDAPAIQAAIDDLPATGGIIYMPPGTYRCTSGIVFPTDRPCRLVGAGRSATRIHVPQDTTASAGVIHIRGSELRQSVEYLDIYFDQPDTNVRVNMHHYVPAVYAQGMARWRVQHVRIQMAWDGIDMRGNANCEINDLEMSHFNSGIQVDGSLDSIRIAEWHDWPFGGISTMTANQMEAMYDPANVGLRVGRTDGLHLSNCLFLVGTGIHAFPGVMAEGRAVLHINNCQFDTWNGLVMDDGNVRINNCFFSTFTSEGFRSVLATASAGGDFLQLSNCFFLSDGLGTTPLVDLQGASGAFVLQVNITGCLFYTGSGDHSSIRAVDTPGGGIALNINDNQFYRTINLGYLRPMIEFKGDIRGTVANNITQDKGTGGGNFIVVDAGGPMIDGNVVPGWGLKYDAPAQPQGGNNVAGSIVGAVHELVVTNGHVQASGLEAPHPLNTPPFAMRMYTGILDGAGAGTIPHTLTTSLPQLGLSAQAWFKGPSGEMQPMVVAGIDGTNILISGGTAGRPFRLTVTYSATIHPW